MEKRKRITITVRECKKCGYTWIPRIKTKPVQCPRCKNTKWDQDKKTNKGK